MGICNSFIIMYLWIYRIREMAEKTSKMAEIFGLMLKMGQAQVFLHRLPRLSGRLLPTRHREPPLHHLPDHRFLHPRTIIALTPLSTNNPIRDSPSWDR
jgi:hypothetical protein